MKHTVKLQGVPTEFDSKYVDSLAAQLFTARMNTEKGWYRTDFMISLFDQLKRRGTQGMSSAQLAWVHYWANRLDVAAEIAKMPVEVDGTKLKQLFDESQQRGSRPQVHVKVGGKTVKLKPAPDSGKNAGSIYLNSGEDYLGKITADGKFLPTRALFDGLEESLVEFCQDPKAYAIKFGRDHNACAFCGLELTTRESVFNGFGKQCAENWGLEYLKPPKDWTIPQTATETHGDV